MPTKKARKLKPKTADDAAQRSTNNDRVIDPAEKYYEQSRADFHVYDRTTRGDPESAEYLEETNQEAFGSFGNPRSRQGFDPRTFRRQR